MKGKPSTMKTNLKIKRFKKMSEETNLNGEYDDNAFDLTEDL